MAWLSMWDRGLGREADRGPAVPVALPPREAAMTQWYDFLDRERSRLERYLRRGLVTASEYALRLDELGELEASLTVLARPA